MRQSSAASLHITIPNNYVTVEKGSASVLQCQYSSVPEAVFGLTAKWFKRQDGQETEIQRNEYMAIAKVDIKDVADMSFLLEGNYSLIFNSTKISDDGYYFCTIHYWFNKGESFYGASSLIKLKVNSEYNVYFSGFRFVPDY